MTILWLTDKRVVNADRVRPGGRGVSADSLDAGLVARPHDGDASADDAPTSHETIGPTVRVAVVDDLPSSRIGLIWSLRRLHPDLDLVPFDSAAGCIAAAPPGIGVILYHDHRGYARQAEALRQVSTLKQAFPTVPVLVLAENVGMERLQPPVNELERVACTGAEQPICAAGTIGRFEPGTQDDRQTVATTAATATR